MARSPSKRWNSVEPLAEAHLVELVHGPRRQPVAAGLLARERLALDDDDVVAGLGQPVAGGRAGRATADDEDVVAGRPSLDATRSRVRARRRSRQPAKPPASTAGEVRRVGRRTSRRTPGGRHVAAAERRSARSRRPARSATSVSSPPAACAPCRHGAADALLAADVAAGAVRLARRRAVARVDEAELVGDVGEGLQHLAVVELRADAALAARRRGTSSTCWRRSPGRRRAGRSASCVRRLEAAGVDEGPERAAGRATGMTQNGIRWRRLAAATYGGSGLGGGGRRGRRAAGAGAGAGGGRRRRRRLPARAAALGAPPRRPPPPSSPPETERRPPLARAPQQMLGDLRHAVLVRRRVDSARAAARHRGAKRSAASGPRRSSGALREPAGVRRARQAASLSPARA